MINIFEMINDTVKRSNNYQYGEIGKQITEDRKKELLGLTPNDIEIYDSIRLGDRERLCRRFNQQSILQSQQFEKNNISDKMIQIL